MYWTQMIICAFLVSVMLTGILIPQVLNIAFRRKLFDKPDRRKQHKGTIPRLGGSTFFPSVMCSISLVFGIALNIEGESTITALSVNIEPLLLLLSSITVLYLIGLADDIAGLRYRSKFMAQIVCSLFTIYSGVIISNLYGILWIHQLSPVLSWLVTAFMVIYIINAINLIDGIDGLAAGLSIIATAFYTVLFYLGGEYLNAMIAIATCGSLISFFYFNVFGNPAKHRKIFMGDTGSMTVGMVIAYLSIEVTRNPLPALLEGTNPMLLAITPILIPLFDVVRVTIHRVKCRRNPFLPDRSHIHHKLLALGCSPRQALGIILGCSIILIILNVWLSKYINTNILLFADIIIWCIVNTWITGKIKVREKALGKRLYE